MKSILELFAQDKIKVDERSFDYTIDYLDKLKKKANIRRKNNR